MTTEMTISTNGKDPVLSILEHVISKGEASEEEITGLLGDKSLARATLQKMKQAKAITQKSYDEKGKTYYAWTLTNPDRFRGKGTQQIFDELFGSKDRIIYGRYMLLKVALRLTRPSLGGFPREKELVFRRIDGKVWLPSGTFRAMMRDAARLVDGLSERARKAIENYSRFEDVLLEVETTWEKNMAPEGRGILSVEALPIGTRIPLSVLFPTTQITKEQLIDALATAGKYIGYSIKSANQGWGKFELDKFELE